MSKRHYVITTRPVHKVTVNGLPDQYWYEHDVNTSADTANPFMRCGIYTDRQGVADKPSFFAPGNEDADYTTGGANPFKPQGSSLELFTLLFAELELQKKDLLLFMFGFENNLKGELDHLEILHKEYVAKDKSTIGRILMLTWPSQGLLKYNEEIRREGNFSKWWKKLFGNSFSVDEHLSDAAVTGRAFAVWMLKLQQFMQQRYAQAPAGTYRPRISVITQSMANHVLKYTSAEITRLQQTAAAKGLFDNLILTSPDIRNTIFENDADYRNAAAFGKNTWLVYSPQDPVLQKGDALYPYRDPVTGNKQPRLGKTGPQSTTGLPANLYPVHIEQLNVGMNPFTDRFHRYFQKNEKVVAFYNQIFSNTAPKEKQQLDV